jgi:hypothetical protein
LHSFKKRIPLHSQKLMSGFSSSAGRAHPF